MFVMHKGFLETHDWTLPASVQIDNCFSAWNYVLSELLWSPSDEGWAPVQFGHQFIPWDFAGLDVSKMANATLIRLPLRTAEQATLSKLSQVLLLPSCCCLEAAKRAENDLLILLLMLMINSLCNLVGDC